MAVECGRQDAGVFTFDQIALAAASVIGEPKTVYDVELLLMADRLAPGQDFCEIVVAVATRAERRDPPRRGSVIDRFMPLERAIESDRREPRAAMVRLLSQAANAREMYPRVARAVRAAWRETFPPCDGCARGHYRRRRGANRRFACCAKSFARDASGCNAIIGWTEYLMRKSEIVLARLLGDDRSAAVLQPADAVAARRANRPTLIQARRRVRAKR
jgi:hypothetical protein